MSSIINNEWKKCTSQATIHFGELEHFLKKPSNIIDISKKYWFRLKCVFCDFYEAVKLTDNIFPPLNIFISENRLL